jgi:hypothetical protein
MLKLTQSSVKYLEPISRFGPCLIIIWSNIQQKTISIKTWYKTDWFAVFMWHGIQLQRNLEIPAKQIYWIGHLCNF